jgi:signal transduction histidine kinase
MSRFYKRFIEPRQRSEDIRNRELVLNVLLAGTVALFALAFSLLLVSLAAHNTFVLARTIVAGFGLLAALLAYKFSRSGRFTTAAYILLGLYCAMATGAAYRWGVTVPTGVLLFGLVLILSGIILGARTIPYAMGCVVLIIVVVRTLQVHNVIHPDFAAWADQPLNWGTVIGCIMIFGLMATVSQLYTSQMERSLKRARRAEAALRRQAQMLEITVERRTRELQDAQLEKVQQMYRFAELGQISTALLHDLANHLTTLSLDIEGLEEQNRSRMLQRAKRSIRYIDDMVGRVRDQLHGRGQVRAFNVANEIQETVDIMKHRAQDAGVRLQWEAPADKKILRVKGESVRFRQLMANLVSNGIDAYEPQTETGSKRDVLITAEPLGEALLITVDDWGRGISPENREKLFEPFFSTKKTGMGMGLYIAKQFIEEHFGGKLILDPKKKNTSFRITIPRE